MPGLHPASGDLLLFFLLLPCGSISSNPREDTFYQHFLLFPSLLLGSANQQVISNPETQSRMSRKVLHLKPRIPSYSSVEGWGNKGFNHPAPTCIVCVCTQVCAHEKLKEGNERALTNMSRAGLPILDLTLEHLLQVLMLWGRHTHQDTRCAPHALRLHARRGLT